MEDQDQPLKSFPMALSLMGEGNEFRTQNLSPEDYERRNVIERTQTGVHVYCDLMDVKHGTIGPRVGTEYATTMVFRFRFDSQKNSRRIYRASIKIDFASTDPSKETPEVSAIAPEERWSLATVTDHEEIVNGGELSFGASGGLPVTATGTIKREKKTSRDVRHATTVSGSINLGHGRNAGRETVASWLLIENESRSTGVPDSARVAVRLKRDSDEPFSASVKIKADADLATRIEEFLREEPLDDPIFFNPRAESEHSKGNGRFCGCENLGDVDLYGLCDARIMGCRYTYSTGEN